MLRLRRLWIRLKSSFWFIPAVMLIGTAGLAALFLYLDSSVHIALAKNYPRIFGSSSEGARTILAAIAGSMITVAGTTFSITVVALSLAANQYSPRILRHFMGDRGNQVVLGVFVSVFAYCIVVLRTIRGGEESFIPSYALLVGILLGLVAIAFLIYFVHHIASTIQVSTILANIYHETIAVLESLFPERAHEVHRDPEQPPTNGNPLPVASNSTGYIQDLDEDAILRWAEKHDTVVQMLRGIGEFTIEGEPLVQLYGFKGEPDGLRRSFAAFYSIASSRTLDQDPGFGVRQIVDVALKALSPGINDSTTAASCLDYLGAIVHRAACLKIPPWRLCADGKPRILARRHDFESLVDLAFHQIRQSAANNVMVYLRMISTLRRASSPELPEDRRRVLWKHVALVAEAAKERIQISYDKEIFNRHLAEAASALHMDYSRYRL